MEVTVGFAPTNKRFAIVSLRLLGHVTIELGELKLLDSLCDVKLGTGRHRRRGGGALLASDLHA